MAIVGNTASEIGDVMIMTTEIPLVGISSITGFVDSVVGVTGTRLFEKKFRYSLDGGLNFNQEGYIDLTTPNLTSIPVDPSYDIFVEYRYERVGTDTTGLLEWNFTELTTTNVSTDLGPVYSDSVFNFFYPSVQHPTLVNWCLNVTEKMYRQGLLAKSLTRGENQNIDQEDRDFIDIWRSISCYFSLLVGYARGFRDFRENKVLLVDFLSQRGMYVCQEQNLVDLQYIQENYWDEMRHRGTALIAKPKGTDINGTPKPVDGELLRLICYNAICDEFLFAISEFNKFGWVVNEWSPLWKGISGQAQLTKIYEQTVTVEDLSKYPLINSGNISIANEGGVGNVMVIDAVPDTEVAGIGIVGDAYDADFATNVDPNLSYELSFLVKGTEPITVQVNSYSQSGTPISMKAVNVFTLPDENVSLQEVVLPGGTFMKVQVIIRPYDYLFDPDPTQTLTSLNTGTNLKFKSEFACKLIPKILLDNTNGGGVSGELRLYNIRFAPLSTPYSTGFINTANLIQTWIKNNQKSLTEDEIYDIIKFYLIPYTASLKNNYL